MLTSRWLPWSLLAGSVALLAAGGVWGYRWGQARQAEADAAREQAKAADKSALLQAGLVVASEATAKQLETKVGELTEGNAALASELSRLRRAAPDSRVTTVEDTHTGPVAAEVAVHRGAEIDLRVSEITTETRSGVVALAGTAEAWLMPDTLIARRELHGTYLVETSAPPACPTPWGALAATCAACGGAGAIAGALAGR